VLFEKVSDQWRMGPAGPFALDYGPLFRLLDRECRTPEAWDDMFHDIRILESAALEQMRREAKR
jgi:hypothetical protein